MTTCFQRATRSRTNKVCGRGGKGGEERGTQVAVCLACRGEGRQLAVCGACQGEGEKGESVRHVRSEEIAHVASHDPMC
eukprot:12897059-Prorocentrum_lima.AAC.1